MLSFLSALQFLTVIPIKLESINEQQLSKSLVYFPFIGLLIGLIVVGLNKVVSFIGFGYLAQSIFLVVSLICITGGLHLDGLADTADAILSRKPKEGMLKIMRDSHIGVMGVLALIGIILLKIGLLFSINLSSMAISLMLMCILSRWSMVFAIFVFPYARPDGKAKVYIAGITKKIFLIATFIALVCAFLFWQFKGLLVMLLISVFTFIFGKVMTNKVGGITGDTLGAINEINELVVLLLIISLNKLF